MKKYFLLVARPTFFFIVLLSVTAFSFSAFIDSTNAGTVAVANPEITSLSPSPIYVTEEGTELTINGTGFRELEDCGNAFIAGDGNKIDSLISWSDTKVVVKLIKNQPLGIGQHEIVVKSCLESSPFPLLVKQAVCDTEDDWACTGWGSCSVDGIKTRTCTQEYECDSIGVPPTLTQACTPSCTKDTWACDDWESCSAAGTQNRTCTKVSECSVADTPSPATSQSCTAPQPACTADTWSCGSWGTCSPSGIQSRSCTKTFDCSNAQTASPATDQFCEAPNKPQQNIPSGDNAIANQSTIIKSTVKLVCPVDDYSTSQGSGTIIDSKGTILTNKHVIAGTLGCFVGFIDEYDDEPYFAATQIADIVKTSSTQDIAILEMRNPNNTSLNYIDIDSGTAGLSLGDKIMTYGYPARFGEKITYTSGDFSGTDGNYFKTTAILEYGNSGGGAYSKDGMFIGVPSAVQKGELNSLGYILSVKTINAWLSGTSGIAYNNSSDNNYPRVSALEDIDLDDLGNLSLFIPETDEAGNIIDSNKESSETVFSDLLSSHKNSEAIVYLNSIGMIDGYPDGTFKPDNPINRGELMKILVEGGGYAPSAGEYNNCFSDVKDEWFAPYVCYAESLGWVDGYPNGTFKPGQTVNKAEAIRILLNSQDITVENDIVSEDPFADVDKDAWFAKYVARAKIYGILEETGEMFYPSEGMKRAGICENLYRILDVNTGDIDSDNDGILDQFDLHPNSSGTPMTKSYDFIYNYPYDDKSGTPINFTVSIPEDYYHYYSNFATHAFNDNFENIDEFITTDDPTLKSIVSEAVKISEEKGLNYIALLQQLVWKTSYTDDILTGYSEYPKYPLQTIIDGTGDCEDSAFLLATLFKIGSGTVRLVLFQNHIGVALEIDDETLEMVKAAYGGTDYMSEINSQSPKDKKFLYIETTDKWEIGDMPETLRELDYEIIYLD